MLAGSVLTGSVLAGVVLTGGTAHAATTGGALYAWGDNSGGQVGIGWVTDVNHPVNQPLAVSVPADVTQAATVAGFGAAVRADGSVWVWGTSAYLHGDGGAAQRPAPHAVPGLPPVTNVSLAWDAAFAVGRDGSLWAWGDNTSGQFGTLATGLYPTPVKLVSTGVVDVADTHNASAYLTTDGSVWTAGINSGGELGNGTYTPRVGFAKAWTPSGITQLAATDDGFVALRSDGWAWVWGAQYGDTEVAAGRLGSTVPKPTRIDSATGLKQISAGLRHVLALAKDGTVWAWGDNSDDQFGTVFADRGGRLTPSPLHLDLTGITQVTAADLSSGAIRSDQMLLAWGENPGDRLGLGTGSSTDYQPTPVVKNGLFGVTTAVVGSTAFAVAGAVTVAPRTIVPSVLGTGNTQQLLHDAGLAQGNVYTTPDDRYCNHLGEVKSQSPVAGTSVVFGSRVDVTVVVRPSQPCL